MVPSVVVVLLVVLVDRFVVWSEERRGLLRGTTDSASALNASATRLGWLLTRLFQPVVSITSDALLCDGQTNKTIFIVKPLTRNTMQRSVQRLRGNLQKINLLTDAKGKR